NSYARENFASATTAAKKLSVQVAEHGVKSADELKATFSSLKSEPGTGIFQVPDDLVESEAELLFETARRLKLPTMFNEESWAIAGAMAAYGPDYLDMGQRAATLIDKILKGSNPASLPVEAANKFDLTINYRTANFIGFPPPPAILKRANKVIR
ncbi:MAG TPA: ABC transporter substrate binding protein, partial [Terriglobales bacterium]|nr:ABC transporter substrate binding protein [Terriglobales bacterium]